jgi:hypothetical protein
VFVNLDDQDWWISNNAQFISWDLGEVESHKTLNLQPYQIAFDMWNYLKTVYHLKDDARGFQHEHDLQEYIYAEDDKLFKTIILALYICIFWIW